MCTTTCCHLHIIAFLLNHSTAYKTACVVGWIAFFLEAWFFPGLKQSWLPLCVGGVLVVGGQIIRTLGMVTAGSNFNHLVQDAHDGRQRLVTHGIYTHLRHPAYFGWFWWSVGTQVLLANPLCTVAYAAASWRFFNDRIPDEEEALSRMFGDQYKAYKEKTIIGIPFLSTGA